MPLTQGVHKISMEEYLTDPCPEPSLSRSTIMDLLFKSPLHAWANNPRLNPLYTEEKEDKFDIGESCHCWFLEGVNKMAIIEADDWRTKAAKEAREEARNNGKIPMLEKQATAVRVMVDVARNYLNHSDLAGLFDDGDAELTYLWEDGPSWCRSRVDKISKDRGFILDYKTTGTSANPEDFIRIILSHGYDVQESFYRRGVKAVEGIEPKFIFMVQETDPPYPCSFIGLSPEFQAMAEQKVIRGMDLWRNCMAKREWPGYPSRVCYLDPPPWALNWEMRSTFLGQGLEEI